ncbi:GMC family oxidoreductase [Burkholderia sp. D-99]|uniref:GMC family oxidoreductase n=1 Tax=Burkholderia sp. D-99 TaxID=2717316 RepID=UPI001422A7F6|nr:GMC family oxidoreductase N-terminal domain-containing protein [Burkholderia sp. D-99]NHV25869.1 choline dehydrogenase [Burkholderia sp. D-99]
MNFDFIVVGAGSAGCVVADRISENGKHRVLLLEAGRRDDSFWGPIPLGITRLLNNPRYAFLDRTEPSPEFGDRSLVMTQGKMLGGTSSLNGLMYVRGDRADYDGWSASGCHGWSYDEVLPYFRKSQHFPEGDAAVHGRGGPLKTSIHTDVHPLTRDFIQALVQTGLPANGDTNGGHNEGVGLAQTTIRDGVRQSTAATFLARARERANLVVRTDAPLDRVIVEQGTAVAVRLANGEKIRATREIVVCAGAISSPQILQRSGIGDARHLQALGIPVTLHRPEVGHNLQDQLFAHLKYRLRDPRASLNHVLANPVRMALALLRWHLKHDGILAMPASELTAFARTAPDGDRADVQIAMLPFYFELDATGKVVIPRHAGLTISAVNTRPFSRGKVHIVSANPLRRGEIAPHYLSDPRDVATLTRGIRLLRTAMAQPVIARHGPVELHPQPSVESDEQIEDFLRRHCETIYHPVGTCRMGSDDAAVVDPALRVNGLRGLRVADASVMPCITTGNTNAPTIMIGEKAADMILRSN